MKTVLYFIFSLCLFAPSMVTSEALKIKKISGDIDDENYIFQLLKMALEQNGKAEFSESKDKYTQAKIIASTEYGELDVMWAATSEELEKRLLPIRIPIFKGLLGYRISLVKDDFGDRLIDVDSLIKLRKFSLGQGKTWADTKILQTSGLNVVTSNKYMNLFYMLEGGRFDMYPRGIMEIWNEVETHKNLNLAAEKNVVLLYKMPAYYFVSKDNPGLHQRIKDGLEKIIKSGEFDRYLLSQKFIVDSINRAKLQERNLIEIFNPFLAAETPLNRDELWFDPYKKYNIN